MRAKWSDQAYPSGGLGLTKGEWEKRHGPPRDEPAPLLSYEGDHYLVIFSGDNVWNPTHYPAYGEGVSLAQARAAAQKLMPEDTRATKSYRPDRDRLVELYRSEFLRERFRGDMWGESEPGTFLVLYKPTGGKIQTIITRTGDQP